MAADDTQIGGTHYTAKKVQPWHAMEAWMTPAQFAGYLRGNVIKYLARCDDKGGVEDLKKARHYLDKLIELHECSHGSRHGQALRREGTESDIQLLLRLARAVEYYPGTMPRLLFDHAELDKIWPEIVALRTRAVTPPAPSSGTPPG